MAAQIIDLGKIRWSWQGDWSSSTEYELNDVVRYGGNLYVYTAEVAATNVLPTVTASWSTLLASSSWKGVYSSGTAYRPGDVVRYGGATYISILAGTGNSPLNATYWQLFTSGMEFKGLYSGVTAYKKNDVVRFGTSSYIAILDTNGNVPTDVVYWDLLVESYPSVTGQNGNILTTNGTTVSWTDSVTLDTVAVDTKFTSPEGGTFIGTAAETWATAAALTDPIAVFDIDGSADAYAQLSVHNSEATSSSDVIVYANNGNDTSGWIDLGITGSRFDQANFGITGPNDGYIFFEAPAPINLIVNNKALTDNVATLTMGSSVAGVQIGNRIVVSGVGAPFNGDYVVSAVNVGASTVSYNRTASNVTSAPVSPAGAAVVSGKGNLVVATGGNGTDNKIVFAAGGYDTGNTQMVIIPDTQVHIEIATDSTSPTTGALVVAGGVGITGDTYTDGNLTLDGILYVGPGARNFSDTQAGLTDPAIVTAITGGASSFAQIAFTNTTATSSTDIIAYMNNGTDSEGWIGMGIAGSSFDDATYGITGPGDGYIFHETKSGPTGPLYTGNLVFATGDKGTENKIVFAAGGFSSGTTQMEIIPGVNVHVEIPTPSTSPTTGAFTVVGGVGIQGDMNVQGNVSIQGTITFGGGGTTVETSNLAVTDPAVFVGTNNQADIVDLAFIGEYATTVSPIARTVTNKALTSNVATLTTSTSHTYLAGDVVTISGVDATFNGTFNIIDVPTTTTFTYAKTAGNVSSTAVSPTGTATVNARRRFAGIARDASDGVIKVFRDATTKPTTTVNFSEAGLTFAPIRVGGLESSGTVSLPSTTSIGDVSATEIGYLDGVTSAIQTQLNGKANLNGAAFTAAVSITSANSSSLPLIVRGASGQTADIFSVETSAGGVLFDVDPSGNVGIGGSGNTSFRLSVQGGGIASYTQVGSFNWFGDIDGAKWSSKLGGFALTFGMDTTNYTGLETWTVGGRTFRASFRLDNDGGATLVGPLKNRLLPTAVAASYPIVLSDEGRVVEVNSASATTVTVPTNASHAFPIGAQVNLLQVGAGQVTVAGAGGVTVNATPGLKLRAQWSFATLIKRAENTWVLVGDLTA